jgi:AcrR family transcriptional regulator
VIQRRKRLLSVDAILDASIACIDESGRLTMAELAARLGSTPSSIYHHLNGRTAIIESLRERVVAGITLPPLDGSDWVEQISQWMRSYRRALAEHPNLIPLLAEQTMTAGSVLFGYDRVATLLQLAGVRPRDVVLWLSVLDCFAMGSALDLAAPAEVWRVERDQLPALREVLTSAPRGRQRADEAFDKGLNALLTGMRQQIATS